MYILNFIRRPKIFRGFCGSGLLNTFLRKNGALRQTKKSEEFFSHYTHKIMPLLSILKLENMKYGMPFRVLPQNLFPPPESLKMTMSVVNVNTFSKWIEIWPFISIIKKPQVIREIWIFERIEVVFTKNWRRTIQGGCKYIFRPTEKYILMYKSNRNGLFGGICVDKSTHILSGCISKNNHEIEVPNFCSWRAQYFRLKILVFWFKNNVSHHSVKHHHTFKRK